MLYCQCPRLYKYNTKMQSKQVKEYQAIEDKILRAVSTIAEPVAQTMGPLGGNVIFEDEQGGYKFTNDGVTIARSISVKDPFEDAIIQIIKQASMKTNRQAGDGTSTTILWSKILIEEGLKSIRDGVNHRTITDEYKRFAKETQERLKKMKKSVKNDEELLQITTISANNDAEIAAHAVQVVRAAGEDGYIFLESSHGPDTEVKVDTGFVIEQGVLRPELVNTDNGTAQHEEVPVLVTNKQLYYEEEAETILNTVLQAGYKNVVVVAKDVVGDALGFFLANHQQGNVQVFLVKDPNVDSQKNATLHDLAAYLNCEVMTDSAGPFVDNLAIDNFGLAKKVYSDAAQTLVVREDDEDDKRRTERVNALKKELKKHGDDENTEKRNLKKRLASLTSGIVTVRIGGSTPIEVIEKRFRYDDAISAGRAAVADGYLPGGGLAMLNAFKESGSQFDRVFRKVAEANLRQVVENAGRNADLVIERVRSNGKGYNVVTGEYVDMVKEGIIDPFRVTNNAMANAVSIANAIISSRYIIVNEREDGKSKD